MKTEVIKEIYLDDPIKGRVNVGSLRKTKSGLFFKKNVVRSKHYMRIVQGYGMQKEIFDQYLRGKKGRIAIKEVDTGKFLIASINTWGKHSKSGNYGDGKQIFLAERYMHGSDIFDRSDILENKTESLLDVVGPTNTPTLNVEVKMEVFLAGQARLGQMYKQILRQKGLA